ncbi:hypothetical protein SLE2022_191790 [Rubroshorea leprosula]
MALCSRPQTLALGTKKGVRFDPMVKIYCYKKVDENHEFDPNDWHCYTGFLSGGFYDGYNGGGGGGDGFSDGLFIGNRKQSSACRNRRFSNNSVLTPVSDLIQWREMKEEGKKQPIKNSNAYQESTSKESDLLCFLRRGRRSNNVNPLLNPVDGLWQWNLLKSVETFVTGAM